MVVGNGSVHMSFCLFDCTAFGAQSFGIAGDTLEMIPTCLLLYAFPFVPDTTVELGAEGLVH